jgi:hypothetical protein
MQRPVTSAGRSLQGGVRVLVFRGSSGSSQAIRRAPPTAPHHSKLYRFQKKMCAKHLKGSQLLKFVTGGAVKVPGSIYYPFGELSQDLPNPCSIAKSITASREINPQKRCDCTAYGTHHSPCLFRNAHCWSEIAVWRGLCSFAGLSQKTLQNLLPRDNCDRNKVI